MLTSAFRCPPPGARRVRSQEFAGIPAADRTTQSGPVSPHLYLSSQVDDAYRAGMVRAPRARRAPIVSPRLGQPSMELVRYAGSIGAPSGFRVSAWPTAWVGLPSGIPVPLRRLQTSTWSSSSTHCVQGGVRPTLAPEIGARLARPRHRRALRPVDRCSSRPSR